MRATSKTKAKPTREHSLDTPDILRTARAELLRGHSFRLRVPGSVMSPTISAGDWITIESVIADQLRVGDMVLLCTSSQTAVVHRIIRFEKRGSVTQIVTRGDASNRLDVSVPVSNVVGRVSRVERQGFRNDLNSLWQRLRSRVDGWVARWKFRNVKSS
jgi:signal peptidase I